MSDEDFDPDAGPAEPSAYAISEHAEQAWQRKQARKTVAPRLSTHRPKPMRLPADPLEAVAAARAFIRGADVHDRAASIEAMTARVERLVDADSGEILRELAAQLPLLLDLWLFYSSKSTTATNPDHAAKFLKLGLASQLSYSRTAALIATLGGQCKASASVVLDHES